MSCSLWFILGFSTQSQDQTVCQRSQLKDNFFVCFFYQIHRFSIWSRAKASPQYPLKTAFNAQCEHLITSVCFNFLSRATLILKILTVCSWFWLSGKCSVHLASAESNKKTQLPPFNVKDVQWCYFSFLDLRECDLVIKICGKHELETESSPTEKFSRTVLY